MVYFTIKYLFCVQFSFYSLLLHKLSLLMWNVKAPDPEVFRVYKKHKSLSVPWQWGSGRKVWWLPSLTFLCCRTYSYQRASQHFCAIEHTRIRERHNISVWSNILVSESVTRFLCDQTYSYQRASQDFCVIEHTRIRERHNISVWSNILVSESVTTFLCDRTYSYQRVTQHFCVIKHTRIRERHKIVRYIKISGLHCEVNDIFRSVKLSREFER